MEKAMIIIGFILIGVTAGFFTFLILRMGMHQNRFKWAGALSVVTTLAGGGFLDLFVSPVQFASYCLGYFIGVASYICYLWLRSVGIRTPDLSRPSRAAPKEIVSEVFKEAADWDVHSKCQPSEMTGAIAFGQLGQSTRG